MAILLYQGQDAEHIYKVVYSNDRRYKISKYGLAHNTARAYHISRKLFQEIIESSERDRLGVAERVYDAARFRKKAR
jgi:hypothetical protein